MTDEEIFEDQVRSVAAVKIARVTSQCVKIARDELALARAANANALNKFEREKLDELEVVLCRIIERIKVL